MTCSQCSRWFGLETSRLDSPRKHLHQLPTKMFQLYCRVSSSSVRRSAKRLFQPFLRRKLCIHWRLQHSTSHPDNYRMYQRQSWFGSYIGPQHSLGSLLLPWSLMMLCTLLDMAYSLLWRQDLALSCSNLRHMPCTGSDLPGRYMCLLYMSCSH